MDVREPVLLLVAARVKVAPDHAWEFVEPRLRQALLARLGYEGRELGQPARLSDLLAAAHTVPGVDYVDVHFGKRMKELAVENYRREDLVGTDHTFTSVWSRQHVRTTIRDHIPSRHLK